MNSNIKIVVYIIRMFVFSFCLFYALKSASIGDISYTVVHMGLVIVSAMFICSEKQHEE